MPRETYNTCSLETIRSHFQSPSVYQIEDNKAITWAYVGVARELGWFNKIYTRGDSDSCSLYIRQSMM